jgi:hypothetical protein
LTDNKKYVLSNSLASIEENSIEENRIEEYSISEPSSPTSNIFSKRLEEIKSIKKINIQRWQDEAHNATKILNASKKEISSVFRCFKNNSQKAKLALNDCKENSKLNCLYFFKIYNNIK